MDDRQAILTALRRARVEAVERPDPAGDWQRFADPSARFAGMLESVGGHCRTVADCAALPDALAGLPVWRDAARIVSSLAEVPGRGRAVDPADPHAAADVDVAVVPGEFAVAENGAVWVVDTSVAHRVLLFLAQHVVLVVPAGEIVDNMHDAYARLSFDTRGFGCFTSGPSKTADIEQALVIGAHGPRSLTVFLTGDGDSTTRSPRTAA
jgi:L-lactate dehydrogenase complex protein LldG